MSFSSNVFVSKVETTCYFFPTQAAIKAVTAVKRISNSAFRSSSNSAGSLSSPSSPITPVALNTSNNQSPSSIFSNTGHDQQQNGSTPTGQQKDFSLISNYTPDSSETTTSVQPVRQFVLEGLSFFKYTFNYICLKPYGYIAIFKDDRSPTNFILCATLSLCLFVAFFHLPNSKENIL